MRIQITVFEDMVNIETPGLNFSAIVSPNGEVEMYGLQANHKDPEWPELKEQLAALAREAFKAHKIHLSATLK